MNVPTLLRPVITTHNIFSLGCGLFATTNCKFTFDKEFLLKLCANFPPELYTVNEISYADS